MKSGQLEGFETSCKECIFAQWNNNEQVGCSINKLSNFEEIISAEDEDSKFYVVKGLCSFFRTKNWNAGVASESKAKHELMPKISFFLNVDYYTEEELEIIGENLKNQENKNYHLMVIHSVDSDKRKAISKIIQNTPYYNIIIFQTDDTNYKKHEILRAKKHRFWSELTTEKLDIQKCVDEIYEQLYVKNKKFVLFNIGGQKVYMSVLLYYIMSEGIDKVLEETKKQNLYYEQQ